MSEITVVALNVVSVAVFVLPVLYLAVTFIISEKRHRRRMRELDELASKNDFWGLVRWGDEYRNGKR